MTVRLSDPHALRADQYAQDVVSGKEVAGRLVKLACQRYLDDLERQETDWPYWYSEKHAGHVCRFVERLPHVEGTWDTRTLQLERWQAFVLCNVYGWRRKIDGERSSGARRFTDVYEEVARKNGKSAKISAVALYALTMDNEAGPQIKCAATTGSQARIVFDAAKKMAQRTPELINGLGVECYANSITSTQTHGSIQPINAKASTQDGLNPHLTILDELHAHKTRDLYDVLRSARGARKNPLQWVVTTAGYNLEGVCYEQRKLAQKVLEGTVQADHIFAIIYTLDEKDNALDPAVWKKANPNLNVSIYAEQLEEYALEARESADALVEFTTKRCNVWAGSKAPWVNLEKWKQCAGDVRPDELKGSQAWGGLDLASVSDLAAFSMVVPFEGNLKTWTRLYLPEQTVKPRTERGNVPYQRWAKDGWITVTPGDVTDYDYIERDVREALADFDIQGIAFDPWNAYTLVNKLQDDGAPMVEFRQGPKSYAPAMREFERTYKSRILEHDGNPVMSWMASNLIVRKDVNENLAPDRKNSDEKIDGIVALIMALGIAATEEVKGPSVYEAAGLKVI